MQGADLVVHQRNQGRDHDGHAMPRLLARDGRDLVAQTLATAGGHQYQRIATGRHMFNDALLGATKRLVAKDFAQDGQMGRQTGNL